MTNVEMQKEIRKHCDSHRKEHGNCNGCRLFSAIPIRESCTGNDTDVARNYGILFDRKESVNQPTHYNQGKYECIDVMEEVFGEYALKHFCILNAFKYIWRTGEKNGNEDISKAIWYLNKYLELGKDEDHESNADGAGA